MDLQLSAHLSSSQFTALTSHTYVCTIPFPLVGPQKRINSTGHLLKSCSCHPRSLALL